VSDVRAIQAVLGRRTPAQAVAARDFMRPRRMSEKRLDALRRALENLVPALERRLREMAGVRLALALGSLGEADAETVLARASEPPCVLRFRCQKAPAWCAWEPAAAVAVVEAILGATILGAKGGAPAARKLSPTETRIAVQLLTELVRAVAGALGLAASDFALVQARAELGSWREAGAEAESYRLEVPLELSLGEQTSTLRLYLSGVAGDEPASATAPDALPAHLEHVEVELSARLRGCEVSLDQLLALEEGDVIPLEARLGDPTTLSIEGLTLGEARLGKHRGRLAVRIEHLSVRPGEAA
jgi:flagellar motor switch protein FliM